jgi:hypothetical protein
MSEVDTSLEQLIELYLLHSSSSSRVGPMYAPVSLASG